MRRSGPRVCGTTALALVLHATGLAHAAPPDDVQPVPYNPSQPIPVPTEPPPPAAPLPTAGAGGDAIFLRGGGVVRGMLLEMVPNDHAAIQLPTGERAVVPWGNIERIERPAPGGPPISPLGHAPRFRGREPAPGGAAFVHLDADPGVVLEGLPPAGGPRALACAAPCDVTLPLDRQYRVAGEGLRPSRVFAIAAPPGQAVVIRVSAASRGGFAAGIALTSTGAAAVVVGLALIATGALASCSSTDDLGDCTGSADEGLERAGAVALVAGAAALVGGIVLLASNTRTGANQSLGAIGGPPPMPETSWLRDPVWHDTAADGSSGTRPRAFGIPLLSQRF